MRDRPTDEPFFYAFSVKHQYTGHRFKVSFGLLKKYHTVIDEM